mgnify:CR=1 FL=1
MQVERLDFGKLPPGYRLHEGEDCNGEPPDAAGVGGCLATEYWSTWYWVLDSEDDAGPTRRDRAVAIADAWAHYKARNDPPGLQTFVSAERSWWRAAFPGHYHAGTSHPTQAEARAAAWAWYERRLALADALEALVNALLERARAGLAGQRELQPADETAARLALEAALPSHVSMFDLWPRILTWTDEQVAEVERRIATLPEVLRA